MNLSHLVEKQKQLEAVIEAKHPAATAQYEKKVLAFLVELGELVNEWRKFKYWSNDREPRTTKQCVLCGGEGERYDALVKREMTCATCNGTGSIGNPLLEEYADCVHFIFSIGLEIERAHGVTDIVAPNDFRMFTFTGPMSEEEVTMRALAYVNHKASEMIFIEAADIASIVAWHEVAHYTLGLSAVLGFEWAEVERAYYRKHAENMKRQREGY